MSEPTSPHMARYRQPAGTGDERLVAPTFPRNNPPLVARLSPWLLGRCGTALEIGSGTGQHLAALALAFGGLAWHGSDPDARHRASIRAWAEALGAPCGPPLDIDAAGDWAALPKVAALGPLQLVLSMNVIHIAPKSVMRGIISGAALCLAPGGLLVFYGPFREGGRHTGAGNETFDKRLRAENPDWGVRDLDEVTALAAAAGLDREATIVMPANNRLALFRRPGGVPAP